LSQVVEKVSGKSLRQFTKDRMFAPLNMRDTTILDYHPTTIPITSAYSKNEKEAYKIHESPWEHTGDGAVHSTVEDLVKWGENLNIGTVGGKEFVKKMSEIGPEISPTGETIIDNVDYAFGLRLAEGFNYRYFEHSGSWPGYRSHFMRFLKEYLSVVVLSNYDGFESKKYANEIAGIFLEK